MPTPISPSFWRQPFRYMKWASINKPAYFYSIVIGCMGPLSVGIVPPLREYFGDQVGRPKVPMTYPIPKGPRPRPEGFDD
ncbi:hypothetical protein CC78DRAFT_515501 [Lojkania enalia]|uniref:NADH-ubiquinone oxidoreductase 9.5 kDa subunit n=1 Tax=Lojkania enalia TaxID=147567 RepID=A0A9P4KF58_9PLEO|nr:hypothetical protein CC78DRAFT_515501 [Didymosphaeria enalia]